MRGPLIAWMVLFSGCAPALTHVRQEHPARASAEATPLPEVASMLASDEPAASAASAPADHGHHHHHHGAGSE